MSEHKMKKIYAIIFISITLFGCNSEDVKDASEGNTKVIALDGLTVTGLPGVTDGYHNEESFKNNKLLKTSLTFKNKSDLENLGVTVKEQSCLLLSKKTGESEVCFDIENGQNICMPKEFENLGYNVFTIDLKNLDIAEKNDFQRFDSLRLFKRLDIKNIECNTLK